MILQSAVVHNIYETWKSMMTTTELVYEGNLCKSNDQYLSHSLL